ncbi:hypothetical protein BC628DRAFT_1342107 [Trametes gibbosa]|nr:hypothetical protein BC628DRAFT_1342107 [Trametes gibbosa]
MHVIQQQIQEAENDERRHEELMQSVQIVQSPPQSANGDQRTSPRSDESRMSSSSNLKKVQEFLDEKGGRPLNQVELAGLVSLLQNSVEDDDEQPEPFRFSKSPSTPARGTTPTMNLMPSSTSEGMVAAVGTVAQNGRKTLARNPMGVYRWQGGGSARPRNRYQSPGFGSAHPRPTIKLTPEKPKTDSKRRRVGEDATTSSPQRVPKVNGSSSATTTPSSSVTSMANGSAATNGSQANGKSTDVLTTPPAPRIRTSGVTKPTTPAVPSPLRQTWSQSDSPPHTSPSHPASRPTRAASFMTELIKEVTPPKKPAFANPYESVSSLARPAPKKQPARKTRSAARAAAEKQKEKATAKEPELTPQAIIEATVPKGSKRARPPPELIGQRSPEKRVTSPPEITRRSARLGATDSSTNDIDAPTKRTSPNEAQDEEQPSPKKLRVSHTIPTKPVRVNPVTIEEVEDVEMSSTPGFKPTPPTYTLPSEIVEPGDETTERKRATSPSAAPAFPGLGGQRAGFGPATKSSAPKAPSKLRFSIQVDKDEKMDTTPEAARSTQQLLAVQADKPKDARAVVAAMREEELPKYTFTLSSSSPGAGPSNLKAQQVASATPLSSLPTFDLSKDPAPAVKPAGGFNWAATGMKPLAEPVGNTWKCSLCMLSNPSGVDKCTICEEPRANLPKPAVQQTFDWSKAAIKPPKPTGDTWTCSYTSGITY